MSIRTLGPRWPHDRIPLTFTQQTHWNCYAAGERPTIREVASATLLRGPLDLQALRRSISHVVRRHEALRTRITVRTGVAEQEIVEPGADLVPVYDLSDLLPHDRAAEFQRLLSRVILEPVDLARDSPLRVQAARFGREEHALIVAMNHLTSDGYSMRIALHELFTAYEREASGCGEPWPEVPVQFPDYSVWQQATHAAWLEKHGPYWTQRLTECQRLRFPDEGCSRDARDAGWGQVTFHIADQMKVELQAACRVLRTTLMMAVFATYAGLVLRWCGPSEAIIRFQTNGRTSVRLQDTVGFFASALSLRIALDLRDSFVDLLRRVTAEYCSACAHSDAGYLESQWPLPQFARNCIFNWLPLAVSNPGSPGQGTHGPITSSPIRFVNPALTALRLDNEPILTLREGADFIEGELVFPLDRFSAGSMQRFTRCLLTFLRALAQDPAARVTSVGME